MSYAGVERLAEYIKHDRGNIKEEDYLKYSLFHNLKSTDFAEATQEIVDNHKDYVTDPRIACARHAIFSVSPLDRHIVDLDMMRDIGMKVMQIAYPDSKAYGAVHLNREHAHIHFAVSGNRIASKKSNRHSKAELRQVFEQKLQMLRQKFPQLTIGYEMKDWGKKLGENERSYYKRKRNPGLKLDKDQLKERVQEVFRKSESSKDFTDRLQKAGFSCYEHKGKTFGVLYGESGKRKMRFSRLGIKDDHFQELDKANRQLAELENIRSAVAERSKEQDHEQTIDR